MYDTLILHLRQALFKTSTVLANFLYKITIFIWYMRSCIKSASAYQTLTYSANLHAPSHDLDQAFLETFAAFYARDAIPELEKSATFVQSQPA